MRTIARRVCKLEKQFGTADGEQQILLVVCEAGWGLALNRERCIQILRETGLLPTGRVALVDLGLSRMLSAQARYAAGAREILECWFEGRPIRDEYLIVDGGKLAGTGAHSYTVRK
jgi:hypothetical protein